MNQPQPMIDFARMAEGAVQERLNTELRKMAENVLDPNTLAKKPRKLTITLTVTPTEERDIAAMAVDTKLSLQAPKPIGTRLVFDKDASGKAVTAELLSANKNQLRMDDAGNVTDDKGQPVADEQKDGKNNVVNFR